MSRVRVGFGAIASCILVTGRSLETAGIRIYSGSLAIAVDAHRPRFLPADLTFPEKD